MKIEIITRFFYNYTLSNQIFKDNYDKKIRLCIYKKLGRDL